MRRSDWAVRWWASVREWVLAGGFMHEPTPLQTPRHIAGPFCDRVPPFAVRVEVTTERVRFVGGVSFRGVVSVAASLVCFGAGVWMAVYVAGGIDPMVWMTVLIGAAFLIRGVVLCMRPRQTIEFDRRTGRVSMDGVREIGPRGSVVLMMHAVELDRPKRWRPWKGFALCAWHDEELLMVLAVSKDREFCLKPLRQSEGALDELFTGDGEFLKGYRL